MLWLAWNELPAPRAHAKELKETVAFFQSIKKTCFPKGQRTRKVLIDIGGGNGYLSWVLLAYGRVDAAIVADIVFPDNIKHVVEQGLAVTNVAQSRLSLQHCDIESDLAPLLDKLLSEGTVFGVWPVCFGAPRLADVNSATPLKAATTLREMFGAPHLADAIWIGWLYWREASIVRFNSLAD
jgi:hypothetical protein